MNLKTPSKIRKGQARKPRSVLPAIPEKRYFTISEVATLCCVKPHVLRYWEQVFSQLKPLKRRGNRRFYQTKDVQVAREIRKLLYDEGFTIEGARSQLARLNFNQEIKTYVEIKKMIAELEGILQNLQLHETI